MDGSPDRDEEALAKKAQQISSGLLEVGGFASKRAVCDALGLSASTVSPWLGWRKRFSSPSKADRPAALKFLREHLGDEAAAEIDGLWSERDLLGETRQRRSQSAAKSEIRMARKASDGSIDAKHARRLKFGRRFLRGGWNDATTPGATDPLLYLQASDLTEGEVPDYVERDVDAVVRTRLMAAVGGTLEPEDRVVCLVGPPKSGKTRTALEAVESIDGARLLGLVPPTGPHGTDWLEDVRLAMVATDVLTFMKPRLSVIFIDDAHLFFAGSNLWQQLVGLASTGPAVVVLLTAHDHEVQQLSHVEPHDADQIRKSSTEVAGELNNVEFERAEALFGGLLADISEPSLHLKRLGERMSSTPELRRRLVSAQNDPTRLAELSVFNGALDARMLRPWGTSIDFIRPLADAWWAQLSPNRGSLGDERFFQAVTWATTPVGTVWALLMSTRPGGDHWHLHDAIGSASQVLHVPTPAVLEHHDVTVPDLIRLNLLLAQEPRSAAYLNILESVMAKVMLVEDQPIPEDRDHTTVVKLANSGHPRAMFLMGIGALESNHIGEAEDWFTASSTVGQLGIASWYLAKICETKSRFPAAMAHYAQAAQFGHHTAMVDSAKLAARIGQPKIARDGFNIAWSEFKDPDGLIGLATLDWAEGNHRLATESLEQAIELGSESAQAILSDLKRSDSRNAR